MRDADDGIVLTDREREALAELAESIGDPWLARQLTGEEKMARRPKRRRIRPGRALLGAAAGWVGVVLVLAGAALAVATFVRSTSVASLGLLMMGAGLWRLWADHGQALTARLRAGRTPERPASPLRRPPEAA